MPSLFMLTLVPTSKVTLHLLTCQLCHDNLNPTLRQVWHSNTPTLRPTVILLQQLWKSLISLILVWNAAITIFATGTVSPRPGASSGTRGEMDCGTSGVGILYFSLLILIKVSVVHQKLYKVASSKKLQDPYWSQNTKIIHPTIQNIFARNSWTQLGAQGLGWCGDLVLSVSLRYYGVTATSHLHPPYSHTR